MLCALERFWFRKRSSVTKTSPWIKGFIVPASTFRYGSTFTQDTLRPVFWRSLAIEAEVTPLPRPDITPPVTNMNFACLVSGTLNRLRGGLLIFLKDPV